jgi:hypothetical protein
MQAPPQAWKPAAHAMVQLLDEQTADPFAGAGQSAAEQQLSVGIQSLPQTL